MIALKYDDWRIFRFGNDRLNCFEYTTIKILYLIFQCWINLSGYLKRAIRKIMGRNGVRQYAKKNIIYQAHNKAALCSALI